MEATHEQTIVDIVRDVLGRPGLGPDDDLFDHGGTSLSFVRVLTRINQDLHVRIRAAALDGIATPRNLARCAAAELAVSAVES